jgi:hypothetical protein
MTRSPRAVGALRHAGLSVPETFTLKLEHETLERLRELARVQHTSVSELVRVAIDAYLERPKPPKPRTMRTL